MSDKWEEGKLDDNLDLHGGRLTSIFDRNNYSWMGQAFIKRHGYFGNRQVCPDLFLADFTGNGVRLSSGIKAFVRLVEGAPNEPNSDGRNNRNDKGDNERPEGPERSIGLGLRIALGSFSLIGGIYNVCYAFRFANSIKTETALFYILFGLAGIAGGLSILLAFGHAM